MLKYKTEKVKRIFSMRKIKEEFNKWIKNEEMPESLRDELEAMKKNPEDIYEAFYRDLEFGTAGLRGIMGAGTNRMNVCVIRKVTQGIANYMNDKFSEPSIAISYDSRNNSRIFAETTAGVMCANGVHVYIYSQLMPVSALSFAVRRLHCDMGVMITASHNPKQYNGYKVYNCNGCQILGNDPKEILDYINKVDIFEDVNTMEFNDSLRDGCEYISRELEQEYIDKAFSFGTNDVSLDDFSLIYSPLNGAGNGPVKKVLEKAGLKTLHIVSEQQEPDGDFPTCPYPNPENRDVYKLATDLCEEQKGDLVILTDPDCDRVGISLKMEDQYVYPKGNHIGVLLFDYLCKAKQLPQDPVMVRTIVSTELVDQIAADNGVEVEKTLIGFKYIGEKIDQLKERYVFGFEEGNGYLAGDYVRDKDGVSTTLLVCQMAAYYKQKGLSLIEVLDQISQKYGYYREKVLNFTFEGSAGLETMKSIMDYIRENQRQDIFGGKKTIQITDYLAGSTYDPKDSELKSMFGGSKPTDLPKENIMEFVYEDGSKLIIRPSGTEPKIKVYLFAHDKDYERADKLIEENERIARDLINE